MNSIKITPMLPEHVDGVAEIELECFSMPWSRIAFMAETQNPLAEYLVALSGEEVVGFAGMHCVLDEGYITNIAVRQPLRGQGIGQMLLTALERIALQRRLGLMTLEVRISNEAAIALYKKLGYSILGVRRAFYEKPTEDAYIMTKAGLDAAQPEEYNSEEEI